MSRYIAFFCLLFSMPLLAETVIFENVRPVEIAADAVGEPTRVGVRDGFIVKASSIDEPDKIIATEGFLIPGLAEMHAHVPPMDAGEQQVHDTLMLWLAHGITTIRGMLGEAGHLELRRQLATGEVAGPRLITSGPSFNGNSVSSPASAREMVRAQSEAGYDLLKFHPGLWPEAFEAITETAHGLGIEYSGHISAAVGLDRVLASNQGTIEHLDGYGQAMVPQDHELHGADPGFFGASLIEAMDPDRIPELARRTAESGIANVPTQTLIENLAIGDIDSLMERPAMQWVPADTAENWRQRSRSRRTDYSDGAGQRFVEIRRELIAALNDAGATILLGADSPQIFNVPGDAVHHELELYVASGLTPAEALATGTVNVADYLGESAQACLRPGCVADVVLLESNPLDDISNTRTIQGVMRAGTWHDRKSLDEALEAIAERAGGQ